jgi:hypothetical protein
VSCCYNNATIAETVNDSDEFQMTEDNPYIEGPIYLSASISNVEDYDIPLLQAQPDSKTKGNAEKHEEQQTQNWDGNKALF